MKSRIPKRQSGTPEAQALLVQWCAALDQSIPRLRTALIIAGLLAAACRVGQLADYLFVSGLLFHWAILFEKWCAPLRSN